MFVLLAICTGVVRVDGGLDSDAGDQGLHPEIVVSVKC